MNLHSYFPYKLYLVISQEDCLGKNFIPIVRQAVKGGVDIVQLREKNLSTEDFLTNALMLQDLLGPLNVSLIINDNLEVAEKINAYGIHVGQSDAQPSFIREHWEPCKLLGYSVEEKEHLFSRETQLADYLGVSPIFSTATKTDTVGEWGIEGLREVREITSKPLVAIGNMNVANVGEVMRAGANCIAVVSAITKSENPEKAAFELRNEIEKNS